MNKPRGTTTINEWTPSWKEWFDINPKEFETFEKWGYYSLPLVDKKGKALGTANTKIISLNNNFCYQFNWEVLTLYEDPGHQLEWFENELKALERTNGTAILMSHVPILNECYDQYGKRYHAIVERYQHIIRWAMYGHDHIESYQVVRSIMTGKPILVNFLAGSGTSEIGKEPSFNVILLDPDTMLPVEYQTYAFDLKHANTYDEPIWRLRYNYSETYNLPDLSPSSFYTLSQHILTSEAAAQKFRNHMYIDSSPKIPLDSPCDQKCRMQLFCYTIASHF